MPVRVHVPKMPARAPRLPAEIWPLVVLTTVTLATAGCVAADLGGVNAYLQSKSDTVWCGVLGVALKGHVYNTTVAETHKLCWKACKVQRQCVSSNFASQSGQCELNNATHYDHYDDLQAEGRGWVYTYHQIQVAEGTIQQSIQTGESRQIKDFGWPLGMYGLPTPTDGCPNNTNFVWETGYRAHDTENSQSNNEWSDVLHLRRPYAKNDMTQHFCMKTVHRGHECDVEWPPGEYCVFKYGTSCPNNMLNGSVIWDDEDENNHNTENGTVPSGAYGQDTRLDYCCMTGGAASRPIALPTSRPFYLFAFTEECQSVQGMTISQEHFTWDNEDDGRFRRQSPVGSHPYYESVGEYNNHKLYYCYYTVQK